MNWAPDGQGLPPRERAEPRRAAEGRVRLHRPLRHPEGGPLRDWSRRRAGEEQGERLCRRQHLLRVGLRKIRQIT